MINGTAGRDLVKIDEAARTASVTDASGALLEPVTLGPEIQVLTADGLSGQDTFLVTPAAGTQFPVANPAAVAVSTTTGAGSLRSRSRPRWRTPS